VGLLHSSQTLSLCLMLPVSHAKWGFPTWVPQLYARVGDMQLLPCRQSLSYTTLYSGLAHCSWRGTTCGSTGMKLSGNTCKGEVVHVQRHVAVDVAA
jgi:hypothetical protein